MAKNKDELTLPRVGDRLMRVMTGMTFKEKCDPEPCTVIYVNKPKQFYTVRFVDSGITESFKVPMLDDISVISQFSDDFKRAFGKGRLVYMCMNLALYILVSQSALGLLARFLAQ